MFVKQSARVNPAIATNGNKLPDHLSENQTHKEKNRNKLQKSVVIAADQLIVALNPGMKMTLSVVSVAAAVLALGLGVLGAAQPEAEWEAADLRVGVDSMTWSDAAGVNDLRAAADGAITVVEGAGGDEPRDAVQFTGEQAGPLRTLRPFPPSVDGLTVDLVVRPEISTAGEDGTVVRFGTQWEVRYESAKQGFSFVVWHDATNYSQVSLPAAPGEWATVQAARDGDVLRLDVNGRTAESPMKGEMQVPTGDVSLVIGATKLRPTDGTPYRPFAGRIARLAITQ